jgi:hypothetical protein
MEIPSLIPEGTKEMQSFMINNYREMHEKEQIHKMLQYKQHDYHSDNMEKKTPPIEINFNTFSRKSSSSTTQSVSDNAAKEPRVQVLSQNNGKLSQDSTSFNHNELAELICSNLDGNKSKEDLKKNIRMAKNRVSAKKSREKKKESIQKMEIELIRAKQELEILKSNQVNENGNLYANQTIELFQNMLKNTIPYKFRSLEKRYFGVSVSSFKFSTFESISDAITNFSKAEQM